MRKKGVYIYAYDTRTIYHPKYETTVYVTVQKQLNIDKNKKKEKKKDRTKGDDRKFANESNIRKEHGN